jgi:hypothetical protein
MQIMHFAVVAHQMPNRIRLRVPGRRGDAPYFKALEHALLARPAVVSARANVVAGSIVIKHTSAFDPSRATLAALGLVCANARAPADGREWDSDDWKRLKLALEIIATGLSSQPIMRLAMIALGASVDLVLHRLSRPQFASAPSPAT